MASETAESIEEDVAAIGRIDLVPKILEVICRTTGLGFAAVARVTEDRWIACAVKDDIGFGLTPGGELPIASTICNEIRGSGEAVVIDHVAEDPLFRDHHTPRQYGFQSYISTPIYHRGAFFGTLCAIDPKPADLKRPEALATFELFAALIGSHLDTQDQLAESEAALLGAREAAELREQFIAVLGHDLRNPLAAIEAGTRLLGREPTPERAALIRTQMQSSVGRMAALINNILDFARGRLGGGFAVELGQAVRLGPALEQVVAEFRTARPERRIDADIDLPQPIACDSRRVAQLLSNLIGNALVHGDEAQPVRVAARVTGGRLDLSVANAGPPIAPSTAQRLFQPFTRATARANQQGLGLGLYIASEIAKAHAGAVTVSSDETETRFTFSMPVAPGG
jgi:signal transduction histidine kinase